MSRNKPNRQRLITFGLVVLIPLLLIATYALFIPRLVIDRESSERVRCSANLKSIGQAILVYSLDHSGQLPQTFQQLVVETGIAGEAFICPDSDKRFPLETDPHRAANLVMSPEYNSYTYHGAGLMSPLDPNLILVTEAPTRHGGGGINIIFGDGRVEFYTTRHAQPSLRC